MADVLGSILVSFGADMTPLQRGLSTALDRGVSEGRRTGERTGSAFADGLRAGIGSLASGGGVNGLLSSITGGSVRGTIGLGLLRSVGGVAEKMSMTASATETYRSQLTQLAGDSKKADAALASLQQTAQDSVFNTGQIVSLGAALSGRNGGDVTQGTRDAQRVVDASSALYVKNQDFEQFKENFLQLGAEKGKANVRDVQELRRYAPGIDTLVGQAKGITPQAATRLLDTGTGQQVYDAILAIGDKNRGKAKEASIRTPQDAITTIGDSFEQTLGKSGEVLNRGIIGPLRGLATVTGYVKDFNDATGGNAGLGVMVGGAAVGVRLLVGGIGTVRDGVLRLNGALEGLAVVANQAAASTNRQATAQTVANVGGLLPGYAVPPPTMGSPGLGAAIVSLPRFARYGKEGMEDWKRIHLGQGVSQSLLTGAKGVATIGLPMVAEYAGGKLSENKNPALSTVGGLMQSAGLGATIGGTIGSFVPVIGNAVGAAIGAGVALAVDGGQRGWEAYEGSGKDASSTRKSTDERTAKGMEQAVDILKDIRTKTDGGGARARSTVSLLERERAAYMMLRSKNTGFG